MAVERTHARLPDRAEPQEPFGDWAERLRDFDGPPEQFLAELLASQCRREGVTAGAVLRLDDQGRVGVVAAHPPLSRDSSPPPWLSEAAEHARQAGLGSSAHPLHRQEDLYGQPARRHIVLIPLPGSDSTVRGVAAFLVESRDPDALRAARERLELTGPLLSLYEMRQTLQRRNADLRQLRSGMEVLAAVNERTRFRSAAMAVCNEIASRWGCERVGLGLLKGRYVQLKALSHTEKISRKMKLVQDIEAAMEECLDQDVEVLHPSGPEDTFVSRAAAELSEAQGRTNVLSLPLRREGGPVGVLTVERSADRSFTPAEVLSLRLAVDLLTPRLLELHAHDRWFGARAATATRTALGHVVGPRHTWAKLLALAVLGVLAFLVFAKGDYTADGTFMLQSDERRVISAPFQARLAEVRVRPGDSVRAGGLLGELDTEELESKRLDAKLRQSEHLKQAKAARARAANAATRPERDEAIAEAELAEIRARKIEAEVRELDRKLAQARMSAPMGGTVISEDLTSKSDPVVEKGEPLFEIAELGAIYAELSIPEDEIGEVREGLRGELAPAAFPDRKIGFTVERILPVAEAVEEGNVFRVRLRLDRHADWMRPGMEGVAKVHLGRRSYAWLWSRRLVNWVRMKLWL